MTRDYTLDAENIKCPALIVHGLNDDNVRTKEFDLMYQAYQKAGVNVKLLLHQDAHLTPSYPAGNLEFYIDGESYNNVLNRWLPMTPARPPSTATTPRRASTAETGRMR